MTKVAALNAGEADWWENPPADVIPLLVANPDITVARVDPDYRLTLNPSEVADAFEVPLAFLMDAQNHALHSRDWKGVIRRYYAMPFGERYIWGVTAGILRNLYERLYGE